jgi:hypothetical protein
MLSASPHYDRECLMTAVTGRCTPPLAHQALTAGNVLRVLHGGPDSATRTYDVNRNGNVSNKPTRVPVDPFFFDAGRHMDPPYAEMAVVGDDIPKPPRRSRWSRLLRDMRRFLMSPRAW